MRTINEIDFKITLNGMKLWFVDKIMAYKMAILYFFNKITMDDMAAYRDYDSMIKYSEWLESTINTYNVFPTESLDAERTKLVALKNDIELTINRNETKIISLQSIKHNAESYKVIKDKISLLDKVLDDIKKTKDKFESINAETQSLIEQGKGSMAEKNMDKANEINRRISDIEYEKSMLADEIVAMKKQLVGSDVGFDQDEYDNIMGETEQLSRLLNKINVELSTFEFHKGNGNNIAIHNNFKNILISRLEQCKDMMDKLEMSHKKVNELLNGMNKLVLFDADVNKFGEHRVLIKYADEYIEPVNVVAFDEISAKLFVDIKVNVAG